MSQLRNLPSRESLDNLATRLADHLRILCPDITSTIHTTGVVAIASNHKSIARIIIHVRREALREISKIPPNEYGNPHWDRYAYQLPISAGVRLRTDIADRLREKYSTSAIVEQYVRSERVYTNMAFEISTPDRDYQIMVAEILTP